MSDGTSHITLERLAHELLQLGIQARPQGADVPLAGASCDSRETQPGDLFCCKGVAFRPAFLANALAAGARAYLCDQTHATDLAEVAPQAPALVVPDAQFRAAMAHASRLAWGEPDLELPVLGITGTKGKSTAEQMVRAIFDHGSPEPRAGVMGSIDTFDGIERFESHNTTPEAPELWRHLAHARQSGLDAMVMEVSSQALKYDRTLGLRMQVGAFLNIGRDHISPVEHPDFEDYFASKLRIFGQARHALVNLGTDRLADVLDAAQAAQDLVCFSADGPDPVQGVAPSLWATDVRSGGGQVRFVCHTPAWERELVVGMPGLFNVENALVSVAIAQLAGIDDERIAAGLAQARVPGRMELIGDESDHVIGLVDYAHNKLSYQRLFASLAQEFPGRKITALFGCPGNKAQERRAELPQEAARFADFLIYTEEDPAHERVEDICAEMARNTPAGTRYVVEPDREQAIRLAVREALADPEPSIVCLLAKGDETRQHRGDEYPAMVPDGTVFRTALAELA